MQMFTLINQLFAKTPRYNLSKEVLVVKRSSGSKRGYGQRKVNHNRMTLTFNRYCHFNDLWLKFPQLIGGFFIGDGFDSFATELGLRSPAVKLKRAGFAGG
jgi:hypothetical protein